MNMREMYFRPFAKTDADMWDMKPEHHIPIASVQQIALSDQSTVEAASKYNYLPADSNISNIY